MDNGGGNKRPLPIDITIDYGFSSDQVVKGSSQRAHTGTLANHAQAARRVPACATQCGARQP